MCVFTCCFLTKGGGETVQVDAPKEKCEEERRMEGGSRIKNSVADYATSTLFKRVGGRRFTLFSKKGKEL